MFRSLVRMKAAAVLVVAAVLAVAGCAGGDSVQSAPTGLIHGLIMYTGGPPEAVPESAGGTVVLSRSGQEIRRQDIAAGQQYSFAVPAGAYVLSVKGLGAPCLSAKVTIRTGTDTARDVICPRK
jgi:Mn2+/Fe2+ NRAMP family transporter